VAFSVDGDLAASCAFDRAGQHTALMVKHVLPFQSVRTFEAVLTIVW